METIKMSVLGNLMNNSFMPQSGTGILGSYTGMNGLGGYGSFGYGSLGGLTGYGDRNFELEAGFAIGNALLGCAKQYLTCHAGKVGGSSENDTNQKELNEVIRKIAGKEAEIYSVSTDITTLNNTTIPGIKDKITTQETAVNDAKTAWETAENAANSPAEGEDPVALKKAATNAKTDYDKAVEEKTKLDNELKAEKEKLAKLEEEKNKLEGEKAELEKEKEQIEAKIDESTLPQTQSQKIAKKTFDANNRAKEKDIMQLMGNFRTVTDESDKRAAANKFNEAYKSNGNFAKNIQFVRYHEEVQKWLDENPDKAA